jgi:ribonuclease P protein component
VHRIHRRVVSVVNAIASQEGSNPRAPGKKNPRSGRLLRHADFERVYKQGRRHFAAHMTVFYLQRPEGDGMRVGFTVGRVLGGAVERNRMKRRLRESVRLSRPAVGPAVDVVINPKKSVRTAEFAVLLSEVSRAFEVIAQKMAEKPRGGA